MEKLSGVPMQLVAENNGSQFSRKYDFGTLVSFYSKAVKFLSETDKSMVTIF